MQTVRAARKQSAPALRRKKKSGDGLCTPQIQMIVMTVCGFFFLALLGLFYEFSSSPPGADGGGESVASSLQQKLRRVTGGSGGGDTAANQEADYLTPIVPVLPIFSPVPGGDEKVQSLMKDTISGKHPTVGGVIAILQHFLQELHKHNRQLAAHKTLTEQEVITDFVNLVKTELEPFEAAYRDKTIFPVRDDDSIFLSLAAYREHLLADTLKYAFSHALHPEKLYVGAVIQNCFGKVMDDGVTIDPSGLPCRTGHVVVGKDKQGHDQTKVSDAPVDPNGIADFCAMEDFAKYCTNGQVRVLYVHESESQGPAMARYYASKLWGGETYFVQCDSHLQFADHWDAKYIAELQATRNYPKSVLSSYPPGFQEGTSDGMVHETGGARLCSCETRVDDPNPILRINVGHGYKGDEERPTQIPFIAAGFFFARSEFLRDVPFDPLLPWCFMGEEIALSMRAWTHGWDIYAPRKNLIAHQYRPGRLGLPKFWETVNRLFHGATGLNQIQHVMIKRIKHMVGYPDSTREIIKTEGNEFILSDIEHYGLGTERTWDEYMEFAHLHINEKHNVIDCSFIPWCNHGTKD
ncbi:hypothetical protein ACA910_004318 [Epithemia clementina (nom. ined.)]